MPGRDPFEDFEIGEEDLERTIILPTPGGTRRGHEPAELPLPASGSQPLPGPLPAGTSSNPLLGAAATAFALARQLRKTPHHEDPAGLREAALRMIKGFEEAARQGGASTQSVHAGRYALCALIDEAVLSTPWGSTSIWSKHSLLGSLHNETRGGAKFFNILSKMMQKPADNLDLLELLYVCLALGFQGKFAVMDRGAAQLGDITHNLHETIRRLRGEPERELSPAWRGIADPRPKAARYIPLWVVPVAVCGLAVLGFLTFSYFVNRSSDVVFEQLSGLVQSPPPLSQSEAAIIKQLVPQQQEPNDAAAKPSLYDYVNGALTPERQDGFLDVIDEGSRIRVIVHNRGLFASGSARVSDSHRPIIRRVAEVLREAPSPIRVIGHTDSQRIRTVRFPSNWHLSSARAEAVAVVLSETLRAPMELITEGRADTEPLANNDTAEGRQQNRRIEIKIPAT